MAIGVQKSEQKIEFKFIVVYDDFTKPIANSLKNEAIEKRITSTIWTEKQHNDNLPQITNENYVLFLTEKKIKEHLSNPKLKAYTIVDGVEYKKQGHELGIYFKEIDFVETAKRVGKSLKEDWLYVAGILIGGGVFGASILASFRYWSKKKKAKLYLLFRASDKFAESFLKKYVSDELDV